jgi:hypothetical protein
MNQVALPDAFKNARPAQAFQNLDAQGDSLSAGIGSSYGVIHYKGKVWSLQYKGQTHVFTRPDDGSPINYIDVVVLRQAEVKSKSYYPKKEGSDFNPGDRPLCASLNGVTPDVGVPQQQAEACVLCPRNQWKTDARGKPSRECSDYKRLAVVLLPTQTARFFQGAPLMEPVFLRVPAASLQNLSTMGDNMGRQGFHFSSYVTRISFDPGEAHPKMVFVAHQPLTDAEAAAVLAMREDPQTLRIVAMDTERRAIAAPAPTGFIAPPANTGLAVQPAPQPIVQPQIIPPSAPVQAAVPQAQPVDTGFAGMKTINPAPVQAAPVATPQQAPAAIESDADLDAQVAALLPNLN